MKEISERLEKQDGAICVNCGAIFNHASSIGVDCPECGAKRPEGLRWITPEHTWIDLIAYKEGEK